MLAWGRMIQLIQVSFYPMPRNTGNQEQESLHIKLFGIQG